MLLHGNVFEVKKTPTKQTHNGVEATISRAKASTRETSGCMRDVGHW